MIPEKIDSNAYRNHKNDMVDIDIITMLLAEARLMRYRYHLETQATKTDFMICVQPA